MIEPTRSPLSWPIWFPRTAPIDRAYGRFGSKGHQGYGKDSLSIAQARDRVIRQLDMFNRIGHIPRCNLKNLVISSDLELRGDGLPRSGQRKPTDPGVAVYFTLDGKQRVIPCDAYKTIEDNLAAVAATIDALRTIERHGSQMFEAAFTGFGALPSPDHILERNWRDVLDYYGDDIHVAEGAYKIARKIAHPDHGGTAEKFNDVQNAWKQAQEELKP